MIQTKTNYNMKIITYTNNQGLELKVNKFTSGGSEMGSLHHQPNPVRKYGRNWFGHGVYEIPAPGT
jgi:hypothetical protein